MNQSIFVAFFFALVAQQQCNRPAEAGIPACVQARIEQIKKQPPWNPPAEVQEYQYNGRRVFLFSSDCCDQFNELVDEKCDNICSPSGGITGEGDQRCTDFSEKAKFIKVVWKDDRNSRK